MAGVFVLESSRQTGAVLSLEEGALQRQDVDFVEAEDAAVLVLGYPHADGGRLLGAPDILAAYRADDRSFTDGINGFFALVVQDLKAGRQLLVMDRCGGVALYCREEGDRAAFSDSVEALAGLAGRLRLDARGVVEFLETGFMVGEKTHFEEIRRLRPGTITEAAAGARTKTWKYWDYAALDLKRPDARERVLTAFNRHVHDALISGERALLPITGGMDSRAILSACLEHRERVSCYTFGNYPNDDIRLAEKVCRAVSVPHRTYAIDRELAVTAAGNIDRLNSECSGSVNVMMFAAQELFNRAEAQAGSVLLFGIGGEMLRGCLILGEGGVPSRVEDVADPMLSHLRVGQRTPRLIRPQQFSTSRRAVLESYREELTATGAADPMRAAESFYLNNRIANFGARAMCLNSRSLRLWDPWLYTPILEANTALSDEDKLREIAHRSIIERNSPALAGIITARGGRWVPTGNPGWRLRLASYNWRAFQFQRKVVNRLSRRFARREAIKTTGADCITASFLKFNPGFLEDHLRLEDLILGRLVDEGGLRDALDRVHRGDAHAFYSLTNLVCAERWIRHISERAQVLVE
jgi:hypothetical protein